MDLELNDKTALVTGGGRGIGKAIARELALEGVDVVIAARTRSELETTAEELSNETGRNLLPIPADTGNSNDVRRVVAQVVEEFDRLDILVNCAAQPAGGKPALSLAETTETHFWADMNVKVMGYLRCAQEVAPHMRRQGWGRIINISGLAARRSGSIIGSMRNVSLVAMTKNLADELGPDGINVSVVHPGLTRTERTPGMLADQARTKGISIQEAEEQMAQGNSVHQIIDARDVAHVVAFLASPKSIAINGDVIAAGGGVDRAIYY